MGSYILILYFNLLNSKMSELKTFSLEEVAKHNTREDCWIIVGTDVLDVTKYLDEHPGGDVIFECAGTDATDAFENVGHSQSAYDYTKKLVVGKYKKPDQEDNKNDSCCGCFII